ncbi:MAG: DUF7718 family protein [Actinomycetota bacterium]
MASADRFLPSAAGALDGTWQDVVRYDCAHEEVHVHFFARGSRKSTKKRVADLSDIKIGYEEAAKRLYDDWMENRRRYFHGRSKI